MILREVTDTNAEGEKIDAGRWYCCGVAELYAVHTATVEQIKEMLQAARHEIKAGTVIATTGKYQAETEKNLAAAGFSLMLETTNPRMGNTLLKIWMCDVRNLGGGGDQKLPGGTQRKARGVKGEVWLP